MARIENLSDHDRFRLDQVRKLLAEVGQSDSSDDQAVARRLGCVEVALQQLVDVFDEAGAS